MVSHDSSSLGLEAVENEALIALKARHAARERALPMSRELIRTSSLTIRAVHRGETSLALELLAKGEALLKTLGQASAYPEIFYAGYLQDAQKEYAEATLFCRLVEGQPLLTPAQIGVEVAPYLNGLAEAASELRRYLLDQIRLGHVQSCEQFLRAMDDIYSFLITVDYPEAITGGLRRSTDALRGVLERTRGDLTVAMGQDRLHAALARALGRVDGGE